MKRFLFLIATMAMVGTAWAQNDVKDAYHRFFMADSINGRVDSTLVMEIDIGQLGLTGFGMVRVAVDTSNNSGHPNNTPNIDLLVIRKIRGRAVSGDSHFSAIGGTKWGTNAVVYRPDFNSRGVARIGQAGKLQDTLVHIDSLGAIFYNTVADCTFGIPFGTEVLRFELNEDSTTAAGDTSRAVFLQMEAIFQ